MRDMNVSNKVIAYIKGRPNELVTATEVANDLGLEPEQVRYAMRRLIEKTALGRYVTVTTRGNSWSIGDIPGARKGKEKKTEDPEVVPPAAPHVGITFEPVGTLKDGAYVVRSADGKLWKLTAL